MTVTFVTVNITRHETATYEFDGTVEESAAYELIESGEYEPAGSHIDGEDVDIVEVRSVSS